MPEAVRIALRILGLLLLAVGTACLIAIFWPGVDRVATAMGVGCSDDSLDDAHQCTAFDAVSVLWSGVWISLAVGAVLWIVTRPPGRGPLTVDLSRFRRP